LLSDILDASPRGLVPVGACVLVDQGGRGRLVSGATHQFGRGRAGPPGI